MVDSCPIPPRSGPSTWYLRPGIVSVVGKRCILEYIFVTASSTCFPIDLSRTFLSTSLVQDRSFPNPYSTGVELTLRPVNVVPTPQHRRETISNQVRTPSANGVVRTGNLASSTCPGDYCSRGPQRSTSLGHLLADDVDSLCS